MPEDWIESYIKAGKAVNAAKKLARKIIKPGISLLEIAEKCEEEILNQGCQLSFPANISLNEIAAHYSPPLDDKTRVPEKGLLKIDLGSHYDGYIADSAITINLDNDPNFQEYIEAAQQGLDAAIKIFKPGVKLYELGQVIAEKIIQKGLRPIINLGGHSLKKFILHAGQFIPNYKDASHNYALKEGEAFACEPFSTSGVGRVINGKSSYIFSLDKKITKNMPYELLAIMNKIENLTQGLPFSPRMLDKNAIVPKDKNQRIIDSLVRKRVLKPYPILIEQSGAPVAQVEHTIIIDMDGNSIVTTKE
jgi:methionyl aminopeptidase